MKKNTLLTALMLGMMLSGHTNVCAEGSWGERFMAFFRPAASKGSEYATQAVAKGAQYLSQIPSGTQQMGQWLSNLGTKEKVALLGGLVTFFGLGKVVYDKWGKPVAVQKVDASKNAGTSNSDINSEKESTIKTKEEIEENINFWSNWTDKKYKEDYDAKQTNLSKKPEENITRIKKEEAKIKKTAQQKKDDRQIAVLNEFKKQHPAKNSMSLSIPGNVQPTSIAVNQQPSADVNPNEKYEIKIANNSGSSIVYQISKNLDPNFPGITLDNRATRIFGLVQLSEDKQSVNIKHTELKYELDGLWLKSNIPGSQYTNLTRELDKVKLTMLYELTQNKEFNPKRMAIVIEKPTPASSGLASMLPASVGGNWNIDFKID